MEAPRHPTLHVCELLCVLLWPTRRELGRCIGGPAVQRVQAQRVTCHVGFLCRLPRRLCLCLTLIGTLSGHSRTHNVHKMGGDRIPGYLGDRKDGSSEVGVSGV